MPSEIILIAAVTVDGFIAKNNKDKTKWTQDLYLFKKQTMGHPVIMGSNTHNILSKDLPGRELIIIHRDDDPEKTINNITSERCFIAGGGNIYYRFYQFIHLKKRKLLVNKKTSFNKAIVAGAFHGWLSIKKQQKIPKVLKKMQFPCFDALSYAHLAEGRLDIVFQCINKIWDIHPIIPIVKAAGGIITTWNNRDAVHAGNIIVSGNSSNHKKMIKLLKPVSK